MNHGATGSCILEGEASCRLRNTSVWCGRYCHPLFSFLYLFTPGVFGVFYRHSRVCFTLVAGWENVICIQKKSTPNKCKVLNFFKGELADWCQNSAGEDVDHLQDTQPFKKTRIYSWGKTSVDSASSLSYGEIRVSICVLTRCCESAVNGAEIRLDFYFFFLFFFLEMSEVVRCKHIKN